MPKHIVIAAGGTGGHLFPAQALADDLQTKLQDFTFTFMAKGITTNPRYKNKYQAVDITASGIGLKALISIPQGVFESLRLLKKNRPEVVIGFGSFHTFPVLLAALVLRIPIILHEANRHPGKVNRLISRFAAFTGIFFPDTKINGRVVKTDIPVRHKSAVSKLEASSHYGLDPEGKTILIFGGSLGAKKLNVLAADSIAYPLQVLHFTGNKEQLIEIQALYKGAKISAFVAEFEHEMQYAWSLADLVICRAGASTVNEQIAYAKPAIFIPFPFAADDHQDANAEYVTAIVKGASKLSENGLTSCMLASEIKNILQPDVYQKMQENLLRGQTQMAGDPFSNLIVNYIRGSL